MPCNNEEGAHEEDSGDDIILQPIQVEIRSHPGNLRIPYAEVSLEKTTSDGHA